jgi:hypothetical protein
LTNISSTSKERLMSMDEFKGHFGSWETKQLVGKAPPPTQARVVCKCVFLAS